VVEVAKFFVKSVVFFREDGDDFVCAKALDFTCLLSNDFVLDALAITDAEFEEFIDLVCIGIEGTDNEGTEKISFSSFVRADMGCAVDIFVWIGVGKLTENFRF